MHFVLLPQRIMLSVLLVVRVVPAEAARVHYSALRRDRPLTHRIPTKYNEKHSECLIRNTTSNIPPDDGSDVPQNVWAWNVDKARIVANVFAAHWGIVFEVSSPSAAGGEKRFVAVQRVLDWDSETKTLHKPCNHAEISIRTTGHKADLIAGNNKMVMVKLVSQVQRDDGGVYKVRDIAQYAAEVMASAPMDLRFSWGSNNCRDFVRRFAMRIGIVKHASALWGFDELLNMRDYLDPALRKLCHEQPSGLREPCFCRSQTSWIFASWYHGSSCDLSSHCTWDQKSSQCLPKCSDAANQNAMYCENAQWGDCIWSSKTQNCSYSQQTDVDEASKVDAFYDAWQHMPGA